jgi:aryl sulfotransferase
VTAPAQLSGAITVSSFKRKPPPLPVRYGFAAVMFGVFTPLMWGAEKLGRADRMFKSMRARQLRELAKGNPFKEYVPGTQDVIVATYPKSGTNWMMQIAHQLVYNGQAEFDHIHNFVPWPDVMPPFMQGYAIPLELADHWKTSPGQRRVIKSHYDWNLLPHSDQARYIMVIRDPKDVFVSSYHFVKEIMFGRAMPSVDTWFKVFLSRGFMGGDWAENTAGYWEQRHRPNVLVMSFKAMKRDLRGTVLKVAEFMDLHPSAEVVDEVCRRSSFDYMKRIDDKFRPWQVGPWRPEPTMIRSGKQGGSSELMSREQQRQMDAHFIEELKRLNCDFPYEEFCDLAR